MLTEEQKARVVEDARKYVRTVWPAAQSDFEEMIKEEHHPWNAAFNSLFAIEGLTWSHSEAMERAGLEDYE
jgi:hypothetical protein